MILALEGHSYSGKTTLLNYIKDNFMIGTIPEHDTYILNASEDECPPFPHSNNYVVKKSIDFFANLEQIRFNEMLKLSTSDTVYDRSFMSVIIFQSYVESLHKSGFCSDHKYAKDSLISLVRKGRIALPDYFIFVRCNSPDIYLKRQTREISVDALRGNDALSFFEKQYNTIFNIYKTYDRATVIYSDNTLDNLKNNSSYIVDLALNGSILSDTETNKIICALEDSL